MAFVKKDDEEKESGGQVALTPQSGIISGAGNQPADDKAPNESRSGMFTNLNKYIDANRPQAAQFAGQVAGVAEGDIHQAREASQQEANEYHNKVAAQATGTEENKKTVADVPNQIGNWAQDSQQWSNLQKVLGGGFDQNLKNFTYSDDAQNKIKNASTLANTALTSDTQQNLQGRVYDQKGIQTRQGERNFDNLLLRRDSTAQNTLGALAGKNDEMQKAQDAQIKAGIDSAARIEAENKALANQTKTNLTDYYDTGWAGLQAALEGKQAERVAAAEAAATGLNKNIAGVDTSPFTGVLGVGPIEGYGGASLVGSEYVTPGEALKWQNTITPEEQAKYRNLFAALGFTEEGGREDFVEDLSAAGPAFTINQAQYDAALAAEESKKQGVLNAIKQGYLGASKTLDQQVMDENAKRQREYDDAKKGGETIGAVGGRDAITESGTAQIGDKTFFKYDPLKGTTGYGGATVNRADFMSPLESVNWQNMVSPEQQAQLSALYNIAKNYGLTDEKAEDYVENAVAANPAFVFDQKGYDTKVGAEKYAQKGAETANKYYDDEVRIRDTQKQKERDYLSSLNVLPEAAYQEAPIYVSPEEYKALQEKAAKKKKEDEDAEKRKQGSNRMESWKKSSPTPNAPVTGTI